MKEQTTSLSNHENSKKDSSKVEISKVEEDSSSHEYQQNIPINQDSDVNYDYNNNITSPINQPHISSSNLSPMAQGCYNNRFCCPMTQERKINTLLRALLAFSIIELICLPKYLILPIIVIQLLGGPILLVLPWCLLVLIIWSLQLFASVYTDCVSTIGLDQHDIPPTTIEIIVLNLNKCGINTSWFHTNQMNNNRSNAQSGVNQSNVEYGRSPFVTAISERQNEYGIDNTRVPSNEVQHIEFGISSNHTQSSTDGINKTNNGETVLTIHPSTAHIEGETKPQIDINSSSARPESNIQSIPHSPNTTNIRLTMTNGEVILWITACILDIILSIFSIVIGFILLIVCLTEADGLVVRGYESQYAAIVAETIFCVLSLIARLGFIIVIIFLRFNLPQLRSLSPWVIWQSQLLSSARAEEASSATSTGVDVVDMSNTNTNTNTNIISSSADAVIRNNNLSSISWYYAVSRNSIIYTSKVASTIISFSFALLGLVYTSININYAVSYSNYRSIDKVTYSNCDNMVSQYCSLPFPTFTYLTNVSDPNTNRQTDMQVSGTGYTVNVPKTGTFPYSKRGQFVDVTFMNRYDGFSVSAPLLWYLPNVIESQLINFQNIAHSVLLNSTTLIVDLSTGEFHPHFTELDYFSTPGQEKILYTQPATSLRYNTHYAMVVQGLTTGSSSGTSSTLLPSSPLLQSYIKVFSQNQSSYVSDSIVDSLRYQRFKTSVFPVLNTIGVQLSRTQLIWDFHTASRGSLLQSLLSVHNSTLARVGQMLNLTSEELNEGATEYVSQLQPTSSTSSGSSSSSVSSTSSIDKNLFSKSDIYRLIKYTQGTCSDASSGTMALTAYYRINVPWYLDSVKRQQNVLRPELMGLLGNIASQRVPVSGDVGLLIEIPCSVATGQKNVSALVEFGPGIFDTRNAVKFGFLRQDANARGWILWAMDWRGFSGPDIPLLARLMLYDAGSRTVNDIEASIVQGFCSKLAGRYITRYLLQQQRGFLQLPPHMKFSYKFLPAYYIGDSMGSILGGGYTAFTGYERSVFFVAGSPFTFLITRSDLFATFSVLFGFQLYNRVDMRIIISTFQLLFDAAETSGWSQSGVYNKTSSLTEIALGDSTVSTVSGRIFGYNLHAKLLSPVLFPIYGIPERHTNSSTVIDTNTPPGQHIFVEGIFTADAASIPKTNEIPPNPTQVHYCLDSLVLSVQKQVAEYISTGKITNNCPNNGICVYGNTASC